MITNEKFEAFLRVQMSGVTNMFDITKVSELSGLDKKDVVAIMKNYGKYKYKYESDKELEETMTDMFGEGGKEEVKEEFNEINEDIETANEYTREIMDIIDNKDEMTRSDLQGVVMGVVISLMMRGGDK